MKWLHQFWLTQRQDFNRSLVWDSFELPHKTLENVSIQDVGPRRSHTHRNEICCTGDTLKFTFVSSWIKNNLESEKEILKTYSTGQGKKSLPKIFQMLYLAGSLWHKTGRTAARFWAYNSAEKLWAFPGPQKTHTWSLGVPDRMMAL